MRNILGKLLSLFAVVVISALGTQACSDEDVQNALISLGVIDGPTQAEVASMLEGSCESAGCDGDVEAAGMMTRGFEGGDGDFDVLMGLIWYFSLAIAQDGEVTDAFLEAEEDFFDTYYGGDIPAGKEATFGPRGVTISLADACAPGTGTLVISVLESFEGYSESSAAKGSAPWGNFIYGRYIYNLSLSNCRIEGDLIDGGGNYYVSLSGSATVRNTYEEEVEETFLVNASLTINPGVTAAGEEAQPVWGASTPLRINATGYNSFMSSGDEVFTGGACYGGTSTTSSGACGGIFVSGESVINFWWR